MVESGEYLRGDLVEVQRRDGWVPATVVAHFPPGVATPMLGGGVATAAAEREGRENADLVQVEWSGVPGYCDYVPTSTLRHLPRPCVPIPEVDDEFDATAHLWKLMGWEYNGYAGGVNNNNNDNKKNDSFYDELPSAKQDTYGGSNGDDGLAQLTCAQLVSRAAELGVDEAEINYADGLRSNRHSALVELVRVYGTYADEEEEEQQQAADADDDDDDDDGRAYQAQLAREQQAREAEEERRQLERKWEQRQREKDERERKRQAQRRREQDFMRQRRDREQKREAREKQERQRQEQERKERERKLQERQRAKAAEERERQRQQLSRQQPQIVQGQLSVDRLHIVVTCPIGAGPGQLLHAQYLGQAFAIQVPHGVAGGSKFQFAVPQGSNVEGFMSPDRRHVVVTVPMNTPPGSNLTVFHNGQPYRVVVPPDVPYGGQFMFPIPPQQQQPDPKVQLLVQMGFPAERARQALRANGQNVERATNALLGGA